MESQIGANLPPKSHENKKSEEKTIEPHQSPTSEISSALDTFMQLREIPLSRIKESGYSEDEFSKKGENLSKKKVHFKEVEVASELPEYQGIRIANPEFPEIYSDPDDITDFLSDMQTQGFEIVMSDPKLLENLFNPTVIDWYIESYGKNLNVLDFLSYAKDVDTGNESLYKAVEDLLDHLNDHLLNVNSNYIRDQLFMIGGKRSNEEDVLVRTELIEMCKTARSDLAYLYNIDMSSGYNTVNGGHIPGSGFSYDKGMNTTYNIHDEMLRLNNKSKPQGMLIDILHKIDIEKRPLIVDLMGQIASYRIMSRGADILNDSRIFESFNRGMIAMENISKFLDEYIEAAEGNNDPDYDNFLNTFYNFFVATEEAINIYLSLKEELGMGVIDKIKFETEANTVLKKMKSEVDHFNGIWDTEKLLQNDNPNIPSFIYELKNHLCELHNRMSLDKNQFVDASSKTIVEDPKSSFEVKKSALFANINQLSVRNNSYCEWPEFKNRYNHIAKNLENYNSQYKAIRDRIDAIDKLNFTEQERETLLEEQQRAYRKVEIANHKTLRQLNFIFQVIPDYSDEKEGL